MKIGVFGCSWSVGVSSLTPDRDYASWPVELSKIHPEWEIYNYSRGGISNTAILYFFEKYSHLYDINIVKLTGMARNTIIHPELNETLEQKQDNYYGFYRVEEQKFLGLNLSHFVPKWVHKPFRDDTDNFKTVWDMWEKYYNIDYAKYINRAQYNYLKDKADIIFAHMNWQNDQYGFEIINAEDNIENFYDYVFDDGHHLTKDGCYQEALWIERMIKDVNIGK